MANRLRIKRGTRAQINAAKAGNTLAAGEPYLVTDEGRLDVGTATNASASMATTAELATRAPLTGGGTSGTWPIAITGNAATATKLATARTINGVAFDGTADISVGSTSMPYAPPGTI